MREESLRTMVINRNLRILPVFFEVSRKTFEKVPEEKFKTICKEKIFMKELREIFLERILVKIPAEISEVISKEIIRRTLESISKIISVGFF